MKPAKPRDRRIEKPRKKVGDFTALALSKAAYTLSVHDPSKLPAPGAAEIAFAGRSNAGKSSAINTLTGRKRLAYVSKTPGRTQLINFFSLDGRPSSSTCPDTVIQAFQPRCASTGSCW
jgi:ribosome biogenesis GTPase A